MEKVRLQKIIADSGYCSRRKAEEYISQGLVKVNGRPCGLGDKADPIADIVSVGEDIISAEPAVKRYILLNKPRGYVTSMADEMGRKIAADLLTDVKERVYPVGRLDRNSEGLLIFTNDGAFANDIMHPSRHVSKTYRVTIDGNVTEEQLTMLSSGVLLDDGIKTLPCTIEVLSDEPNRTVIKFVIKEGRNRQIRRMCEAVGLQVGRLRRTAIGGVKLGMLGTGEYRDLTKEELRSLRNAVGTGKNQTGKGASAVVHSERKPQPAAEKKPYGTGSANKSFGTKKVYGAPLKPYGAKSDRRPASSANRRSSNGGGNGRNNSK